MDSNNEAKPKRKRIPHEKLVKLQQLFETTDTPSYEVREQLAVKLDMTNREVQVWFQNRRAKLNRMRNESFMFNPSEGYSRLRRAAPAPIRVPTGHIQCGPYTAPSKYVISPATPNLSSLLNHNLNFRTPGLPPPNLESRRPSLPRQPLPSIRALGLDAHLPRSKPLSSPAYPLPPISYLPSPQYDHPRRRSSPDIFFRRG